MAAKRGKIQWKKKESEKEEKTDPGERRDSQPSQRDMNRDR
jgi:hypothetical protein